MAKRRGENVDTPTARKRSMGEALLEQHSARNIRTGKDFTDAKGQHSLLSGSYETDQGKERLIPHVYEGREVGPREANKRARGVAYPQYETRQASKKASLRISAQAGRRGKERK